MHTLIHVHTHTHFQKSIYYNFIAHACMKIYSHEMDTT